MKRGKKYREIAVKVDREKLYTLEEAFHLVKEHAYAHFDETVEMAVCLGVDPKKAEQRVRGTVILPHGTGKLVRVLVLTKGEKESEAAEAGADWVGSDDYVKKISDGWTDVDVIIATPDMMSSVGKLGRILGPRGLMPNPKTGTVTFDVGKAVRDAKAGKIEFRVDRGGNLQVSLGKVSFALEKLMDNAKAFLDAVIRARPATAKGQYLRKIAVSSTMGVGMKVDPIAARNALKG